MTNMTQDRCFRCLLTSPLAAAALLAGVLFPAFTEQGRSAEAASQPGEKIVGMYVHQHWVYKHPYAARTWTLEDWQGYLGCLRRLGFNAVMIWPMLEIMPQPLTDSDRASLEKIGQVISFAHKQLRMKVWIALCPNIVADNGVARQASFSERLPYHTMVLVDPADREAVQRMVRWREGLFRPLAEADGASIIDGDPGSYPNTTNEDFIFLLAEHRKMLDRLRPGIELNYWMWWGWEGASRRFQGKHAKPTAEEHLDVLSRLKRLNPEPWGLMNPYQNDALPVAKKLGIDSRVIQLHYGRIEGEPAFPITNFGGEGAYQAGGGVGPRGVMGNAQTHCVQLPNTFAFARGALGKPAAEADYLDFAEQLIPGQGANILAGWKALGGFQALRLTGAVQSTNILAGWKALGGDDPQPMQAAADALERLPSDTLKGGPLEGLLFGDPQRFVTDLALQLRFKAACEEFWTAAEKKQPLKAPFGRFLVALEAWQQRHGYQGPWPWQRLDRALRALDSPTINAVLLSGWKCERPEAKTPFGQSKELLYRMETYTPRLLEAMRITYERMGKPVVGP